MDIRGDFKTVAGVIFFVLCHRTQEPNLDATHFTQSTHPTHQLQQTEYKANDQKI